LDPIEVRTGAIRKQPIHFGAPGRPLFGFYHPPEDGLWRGVGVVLCNPIGTDQTRSERTLRHLAERLSASGFACLRFDFFGTGDSGGDGLVGGIVRSWLEDVGLAVDELRLRSGAETIAMVGLRIGASLALTHAAERGDVDSLVLWNPCLSGQAFVNEVTRLHKIYARIEPQMLSAPTLAATGQIGQEALGCFLSNDFIDDLSQVDLLQTSRRPARRTLVIDGGGLAGRDALMAHLQALGAAPELQSHPGHKFLVTVSHRAAVPDEVIDSIVGWLQRAYPSSHAPPLAAALPMAGPAPAGERSLVFGRGRPLFGILTPADPARARPQRPPILLTNAGCVNRVGPHRIYVEMARRWARLGFDVLRLDLSGIGDSPVEPGVAENLTYPPSAIEDLGAAIRVLGATRLIVAGLCSGGDYAFQLAAREPRVVGAWLLNPRTFTVLELAAVESGIPPTTSVDNVPRTLREMADRGVDTLLVVSRNDPGVAYVDAYASDEMRALTGVAGYERVDLDGADHSFTPVAVQARVSDLLSEHLQAHH
jgi:alpha-beta hydrolase superfamily lysophospholipase